MNDHTPLPTPRTLRLGVMLCAAAGLWLLYLWFYPVREFGYAPNIRPANFLLDPFRSPMALLCPALLVLAPLLFARHEPVARLLLIVLGILAFLSGVLAGDAIPRLLTLYKDQWRVSSEFWRTEYLPRVAVSIRMLVHAFGLLLLALVATFVVWRLSTQLRPSPRADGGRAA